jgi:hypothetical protein
MQESELEADAFAVILDPEAVAVTRRPPTTLAAERTRAIAVRPALLLGIVLVHAAVIELVVAVPGERIRVVETEPLISVFIRPQVVVSRGPSVESLALHIPKAAPLLYAVPMPEVVRPTIVAIGVGMMAPRPADVAIDPAPFARRAGLQPGEGATVVLRLEVLGTGQLGRIEIEVSGGASEVDREAIAYVKSLPWIGGMSDGRPASMWIRWGVRLQA